MKPRSRAALCSSIFSFSVIPHPISDSIWLARGTLLVGAGHLMFMYGEKSQTRAAPRENESDSLFEHVARLNGPLDDYHPQMILQCLLWGKVELAKNIIINLARNVESGRNVHEWENLPIDGYLQNDQEVKAVSMEYWYEMYDGCSFQILSRITQRIDPSIHSSLTSQRPRTS